MRRLAKGVVALGCATVLSASPAQAQGAEFALGGGLSFPTGDFGDAFKTGFTGLAAVSFVPPSLPVGIQIDGSFNQFKADVAGSNAKDQIWAGTANAVYKFKVSEETKVRPYLIGGVGVYNNKIKNIAPGVSDNSTTKFGVNVGAGFDFKAGGAGLFVEGRFHDVFIDGANIRYIPITAGIRFGGS